MEKREINVDLFRVIATLFVIILHVLGIGGVLEATDPKGMTYWSAWFVEVLAFCAVNCFALITGYVMVNKTTKTKSIIGLWFQVLFYSLLLNALFFVLVPETRTVKNLVIAIFPIMGSQWWYISSYFALFFFIPILNEAINHISKEAYKKFIVVALIGICIFDCILPTDSFMVYNGYSAIWLIVLYIFGAYIKKYEIAKKTTALRSIAGFSSMILVTFLSKIIIHFATKYIFGQETRDNTFISYLSLTIVLASVFLFLFCLNIKINNFTRKAISFFAPATLGIYLIHVQPFVFKYVLKDAFVALAHLPAVAMIPCVLAATLAIFVLCSTIELLRIQLFKIFRVSRLCEMIDNLFNKLYRKVFKE